MKFGVVPEGAIGDALVNSMQESGMSDLEVAEKLGVSQVAVSRWASKKREPRGVHAIALIFVVPGFGARLGVGVV